MPLLSSSSKQQPSSSSTSSSSTSTSTSTSTSPQWRLWVATAQGTVLGYRVTEKSPSSTDDDATLDASALDMTWTHTLTTTTRKAATALQQSQKKETASSSSSSSSSSSLGCTRVSTLRNYWGEDTAAGDWVVACLDLAGRMGIYSFAANLDDDDKSHDDDRKKKKNPRVLAPLHECTLPQATGTTLALCPPSVSVGISSSSRQQQQQQQQQQGESSKHRGPVLAAVGCLDGTVALVSTGLAVPPAAAAAAAAASAGGGGDSNKDTSTDNVPPVGQVLDKWGSPGSSLPLSLVWQSLRKMLVVGRKNGRVDLFHHNAVVQQQTLHVHHHPVRAVALTGGDGSLLLAGSDAGNLCVWDLSRDQHHQSAPSSASPSDGPATTTSASPSPSSPSQLHPALVHHIQRAHTGWILAATALDDDSRRWLTVGSDGNVRVWQVGPSMETPVHSFSTEGMVWSLDTVMAKNNSNSNTSATRTNSLRVRRLVTASETGWLHVYSLEA